MSPLSLSPPHAFASPSGMQTVSDLEPTPNLLRAWADNHVRHSKLEDGVILPLLTYAAQIRSSGQKGLLYKCGKAQNAAIRHISGAFSGITCTSFTSMKRLNVPLHPCTLAAVWARPGAGPCALSTQKRRHVYLTYLISLEKDPFIDYFCPSTFPFK